VDKRGHSYLKTLAREKKKTTTIARMLRRTVGATYQQASKLGIHVGVARPVVGRASQGFNVMALNGCDGMPSIITFI
jgi:hypothetical protein